MHAKSKTVQRMTNVAETSTNLPAAIVSDADTGLPVLAEGDKAAELAAAEFDKEPKESPVEMLAVTQYVEAKILQTLTEIESKGVVMHQTERDVTRTMQSNFFDCVVEASRRLSDQRTILDLFTRATNTSEFKWKELHGLDPKANLKLIDDKTHSPVKLVSRYNYWKSVTRYGMGAPRKGETALRTPFPVFLPADENGAIAPMTFDAWFSAVTVSYEKFREANKAHDQATGKEPKGAQDKGAQAESKPEDNVPFIPALNAESTRKALVKVAADKDVTRVLNELVRLAGEALEVGVEPATIAEIMGDFADMLRNEIRAKLESDGDANAVKLARLEK